MTLQPVTSTPLEAALWLAVKIIGLIGAGLIGAGTIAFVFISIGKILATLKTLSEDFKAHREETRTAYQGLSEEVRALSIEMAENRGGARATTLPQAPSMRKSGH